MVSWWIAIDVAAVCTCSPPQKQWDASIKGHCLDNVALYIDAAALNVVIDLVILVLPLPMLGQLHVSLRQKFKLAGAFVVAYCVIIISILRLVTMVEFKRTGGKDITWNFVEAHLLFFVETPLAIISVSLPSIFSLFKRGFHHGVRSLFSPRDPSMPIHGQYTEHVGGLGNSLNGNTGHFERLEEGKVVQSKERLVSQIGATGTSETISQDVPLEDIQVRTDVCVQID